MCRRSVRSSPAAALSDWSTLEVVEAETLAVCVLCDVAISQSGEAFNEETCTAWALTAADIRCRL